MIVKVWSTLDTFREVSFKPGMNIVLADRTDDSDETGSTNGLGKTMLLRIIRFCLGSEFKKNNPLAHPQLRNISFGLSFDFKGKLIEIVRNTSAPDRLSVTSTFVEGTPFTPLEVIGPNSNIALEDFRHLLTLQFIQTTSSDVGAPSFSEILTYLIRIGKPAFSSPTTSFQNQPTASKLRCTSYLLRLNWGSQRVLQNLLDDRKQINDTIKILESAQDSFSQKSIGELESERVALKLSIDEEKEKVENFNILDDYHDLQARLTSTDKRLHDCINENYSDDRLLRNYVKSAQALPSADPKRPISILESAGAIFREDTLKLLAEIEAFHIKVHSNRSDFLKNEIKRLKATIKIRQKEIDKLAEEKTKILQLLQTSGALDTLIELQKSYTEKVSSYEALSAQLAERNRFDIRKDELTAEISNVRATMKRDLNDRKQTIDEVRQLFAKYTKYLYGEPGSINVNVNPSGYTFTFTIDREGSDGVDQMVVFCFDLAVATLRARKYTEFQTLIHDSTLFADVDPRQYGLALQLAASTATAEGFQYICCLNAGALPLAHLGDLNLNEHIRVKLTDKSTEHSLLGIRLPPLETTR